MIERDKEETPEPERLDVQTEIKKDQDTEAVIVRVQWARGNDKKGWWRSQPVFLAFEAYSALSAFNIGLNFELPDAVVTGKLVRELVRRRPSDLSDPLQPEHFLVVKKYSVELCWGKEERVILANNYEECEAFLDGIELNARINRRDTFVWTFEEHKHDSAGSDHTAPAA